MFGVDFPMFGVLLPMFDSRLRADPDGKRKRRGRKRKTALPEGEEDSGSSSGEEDGPEEGEVSAPAPILIAGGGLNRKHHHDDMPFGASLDACESQGSRPFFITKAKRAKLKEDFSDESDLDDVPHLAGPASHFGGHHHHPQHMHHHHFDEDEQVSAINRAGGSSGASNSASVSASVSTVISTTTTTSNGTNPMAVPRANKSGMLGVPSGNHDDFAHFNIYPELLTLPSPVSGSHQHSHMWFPSPRNSTSHFGAAHPFEMGDAHFVASPIISGLAHSFGNSCGSTSYLNHTPTTQKGFHDFFPSGSSENNPSFEGFIL